MKQYEKLLAEVREILSLPGDDHGSPGREALDALESLAALEAGGVQSKILAMGFLTIARLRIKDAQKAPNKGTAYQPARRRVEKVIYYLTPPPPAGLDEKLAANYPKLPR